MESVDLATVRSVLSRTATFGGMSIQVDSIYNGHPEEKCFRVETNKNSGLHVCKVRFATATSSLSVATEYEAFSLLHGQGVEWVPHIYEFREDAPPYLIVEYKSGESLDKSLTWTPYAKLIVAELSRQLTEMHNINGDYFGHLAGPRYASWQSFLDVRFWHHMRVVTTAKLIDEDDLRGVRALYAAAREELAAVRPVLIHADIKPANIIFNLERRKATLIDFELARFGDIDFEWVKLYQLALRWPEYRELIARPLLAGLTLTEPHQWAGSSKLLLYALYHICSILAFEYEVGLPIPGYRLDDLTEALRVIRNRWRP